METVELDLSPPLRRLLGACEIRCVYGCCGIGAFEFHPAAVGKWVKQFGPHAAEEVVRQLEAVIATCRDEARNVSCDLLSHQTYDADAREEMVTFFVDLRASLAALG